VPTNQEAIMQDNLESKIKTYNEKSEKHAQNWKKIRALVNYSKTIKDFDAWNALEFIIRYFERSYLKPYQETLLDAILDDYGIEYDKWCYKDSSWVQKQFLKTRETQRGQLELPFPDLEKRRYESWKKSPVYSKLESHKLIFREAM
jgi:hypothetical protein